MKPEDNSLYQNVEDAMRLLVRLAYAVPAWTISYWFVAGPQHSLAALLRVHISADAAWIAALPVFALATSRLKRAKSRATQPGDEVLMLLLLVGDVLVGAFLTIITIVAHLVLG